MIHPRHITIIGLGLIGGSLAAACRKAFPRARIVGVSRARSALGKAKKKNWIHEGTRSLAQGLRSAELVVLCIPVDTFRAYLKRIDAEARPGTVVTDTGSVKGFLVRWAERQNWKRIHFVGAHPMAGSHERGIEAARPDLLQSALVFVTRGQKTSSRAFRAVKNFWRRVSQRVVVLSPERHDRLTAQVSHLPHLVASLLVNTASPKALPFAASGFLDTTRVAQSDPRLWVPIFLGNRKELARALERFSTELSQVKRLLGKGDPRRLKQILRRAQRRRQDL